MAMSSMTVTVLVYQCVYYNIIIIIMTVSMGWFIEALHLV